jgi:hypothetical protein
VGVRGECVGDGQIVIGAQIRVVESPPKIWKCEKIVENDGEKKV